MNRGIPPRGAGRFLWQYVCRHPVAYGSLAVFIVGGASCTVAVQYGMKLLVDTMSEAGPASSRVWMPFGLFIALIAVENVFWRLGGWQGCRTVVRSCAQMRVDLFSHLTGHPMRYFAEHYAGALGSRISATGTAAGAVYGALIWNITPPCVDFIGAVVVLATVRVEMALALVARVLLVAVIITYFGIRGLYLEKARVFHDVCVALMAGGMLAWAIQLWTRHQVTAGDVVLVSALTFRILHGSRDLALALVDTTQHSGAIAETLSIIAQPHGLPDHDMDWPVRQGAIDIDQVSYAYPGGNGVLDGVNIRIEPGQRVGIVGPSGAGKTTLIGLLQRLDDVSRGAIRIDGRDIREMSQDSLRRQIAVVPQEPALFNGTIYENILYGRPEATREEVYAAARNAYCHDFIDQLPQGYDTPVGERGVKLSGGQRPRLGIARAFLKNAPILILDEATAALDSRSEAVIQAALPDLMQGRTAWRPSPRSTGCW